MHERVRHIVGPVDRRDLVIPLFLFFGAGIATALLILPTTWPLVARLLTGLAIGGLSWMFPYLNRVLEG